MTDEKLMEFLRPLLRQLGSVIGLDNSDNQTLEIVRNQLRAEYTAAYGRCSARDFALASEERK